ncbi:hypothetical protein GUJ93_ZPchr0007g3231 [Zizania palustris]|nr:hypothetical protein GUJ93_ZPchr0007g4238 [Zizania palustris]KAG8077591.1 hypothetical protein GUJ93_ZPchr0007g3231 [Zizania palustris]
MEQAEVDNPGRSAAATSQQDRITGEQTIKIKKLPHAHNCSTTKLRECKMASQSWQDEPGPSQVSKKKRAAPKPKKTPLKKKLKKVASAPQPSVVKSLYEWLGQPQPSSQPIGSQSTQASQDVATRSLDPGFI